MEETIQELIKRLNDLPAIKDIAIEVSPALYNYFQAKLINAIYIEEDKKHIPLASYHGIKLIMNDELPELQWRISLMGL